MKQGFEHYGPSQTWKTQACVIGAGAGGSAAACALAEQGVQTLVLEEGSHWKPPQFRQDTAWAYRNLYQERGARSAVGNCMLPVPGGRGVGGSTLINSAICFKTPEPILREWCDVHGCVRLDEAAMAPRLARVWKTLGVTINPVEIQRNNNLIFKAGSDRLGLKGSFMPRSAPGCVGCGVCQMGCPTGGKFSADRTFLAEALSSGNCTVNANCRVERVETVGGRVVAIEGRTMDPADLEAKGRFRVEADVFVLSGGPVGSPRFLMANGLADDGICGHNLHLHPASGMLARFVQKIRPWSGVTQGFYVDCWDEGYLLQTYSTSPDQTYVGMPWSLGADLLEAIRDLEHMAMAGPLVHDEDSVGQVTQYGMTFFLGEGDRRKLLAGMRQCARVFFAAGGLEVYAGLVGATAIRRESDISKVLHDDIPARKMYLYASHPMGTCRMGHRPEDSVVDPDGRVWGWENLHVADASVFPTSLGVNPQVTTMAVGLTVGAAVVERL